MMEHSWIDCVVINPRKHEISPEIKDQFDICRDALKVLKDYWYGRRPCRTVEVITKIDVHLFTMEHFLHEGDMDRARDSKQSLLKFPAEAIASPRGKEVTPELRLKLTRAKLKLGNAIRNLLQKLD